MFVQRPGNKEKAHHRYYVCGNRTEHSCNQKYIPADKIENLILKKIKQVSKSPALLDKYIKKYGWNQTKEKTLLNRKIKKLKVQIPEIDAQQKKIVDWLADTLPNNITAKRLNEKVESLENRKTKAR